MFKPYNKVKKILYGYIIDYVHLKATYIISKEITERLALALYFLLHLNQNTSPYTNVGKYDRISNDRFEGNF